jgi:hypothetical protein
MGACTAGDSQTSQYTRGIACPLATVAIGKPTGDPSCRTNVALTLRGLAVPQFR